MFKLSIIALFIFWVIFTAVGFAQEAQQLKVEEMEICSAVEDRQPSGADTTFSATLEQLYCFTKIVGAEGETSISHVWYTGDEEKAKVDLTVKSENWRTWSSKKIIPEWAGNWRVDVVSADGEILASKKFTVTVE
jgi:hypothetical protein